MIIDLDDFGCDRLISDQCQSHDCRDKLDALHYANPNFKVTLFAIPAYMTIELAEWCEANKGWIELAVHGFYHKECSEWSRVDMERYVTMATQKWPGLFTQGFKAPGWQISDGCYEWLKDNNWWVADQSYNNERHPAELRSYVNKDGSFYTSHNMVGVEAWHGHTWDCVGNGIYETFDHVKSLVENAESFQFISEILT